jgi:hypothetical protein
MTWVVVLIVATLNNGQYSFSETITDLRYAAKEECETRAQLEVDSLNEYIALHNVRNMGVVGGHCEKWLAAH